LGSQGLKVLIGFEISHGHPRPFQRNGFFRLPQKTPFTF
jgi:hypothetical protein